MTQVARPDQAMVTARLTTDSQGFFRRRLPPSSPASFSIVSSSYPSLLCLCVPSPLASTQPIPLYRLRRTGRAHTRSPMPTCRAAGALMRGSVASHARPAPPGTHHTLVLRGQDLYVGFWHAPSNWSVFLILDSMKSCKKQKNHAKTISFGRMSKFKANRTYVFQGPRVALVLVGLVHR